MEEDLPKYDTTEAETTPPRYTPRFSPPPVVRRFTSFRVLDNNEAYYNGPVDKTVTFVGSLVILAFAVAAFALSVVAILPHDDWYILQINNTNVQPGVLFRNVILNQNLSATVPADLSIDDTDLSPYFRVGILNWCEGDIVDDKWVKGKCRKWSSLDLAKFYAQSAGHVGDYPVTSSDSGSVYLPPGYPSSRTIRRESKGVSASAVAGVVLNGLALAMLIIGVMCIFFNPEVSLTSFAIQLIFTAIGLSLMAAVAAGPYMLAGKIESVFKNQFYLFGVVITRDSHIRTFAAAAAGMGGGAALASIILVFLPVA